MPSLEPHSESEIEQEPALQALSPVVDALSPLDLCAQEPSEAACHSDAHTATAHSTESAMTAEPRGPRASELPNLISFDMLTPPRPILSELKPHTSSHSSLTPPSQLSSSSSLTVDDLLTLSPIKSPLLQFQVLEAQINSLDQEAVISASISTPEPEVSYQDVSTEITDLAPIQIASPISSNNLDQDAVISASLSTPESEVSHQDVSTEIADLAPIQTASPISSNNLDQDAVISASLSIHEPEVSHQKDVSTEIGVGTDLTPIQTASPMSSNNSDHEAEVTVSLSTPEHKASHQKVLSTEIKGCLSEIAADMEPTSVQTTSSVPPVNNTGGSSLQLGSTSNTSYEMCAAAEDGPTTSDLEAPDTAASNTPRQAVISLPPTSRGETRRRSLAKGTNGKDKAHDGNNSSDELLNNTSGALSLLGNGNGDESEDHKAAKEERRAKAKREAEHRRQQLLSLSPASANVLHLLASPARDSPNRPSGLHEAVPEITTDPDPPNGSSPVEPETPRMNGAKRVPISAISPRRSPRSPLRLIAPGPIDLDDPNRTPARRVLLPSGSRSPYRLPIGDPNRTPARRVTIQPSPTRLTGRKESLTPQVRIEQSSPAKQAMPFSAKLSTQSGSSNLHDKSTSLFSSLFSSLPPATGVSRPLPFPIRHNGTGRATTVTSVRVSQQNTDYGASELCPASNLRQPSSVFANKSARITTKPYSRTAQGSSRLPVTSSMRSLGAIAGGGLASTATSAGLNRPHLPPANLAVRHLLRFL